VPDDDRAHLMRVLRDGTADPEAAAAAVELLRNGTVDPEVAEALDEGGWLAHDGGGGTRGRTPRWTAVYDEAFERFAVLHDLDRTEQFVLLRLLLLADYRTGAWPRCTSRRQIEPTPAPLADLAERLRMHRQLLHTVLGRLAAKGIVHVASFRSGRRQGSVISVSVYPLLVHLSDAERERVAARLSRDPSADDRASPGREDIDDTSVRANGDETAVSAGVEVPDRTTPPRVNGPDRTTERPRSDNVNGPDRTTPPPGEALPDPLVPPTLPTLGALRRNGGPPPADDPGTVDIAGCSAPVARCDPPPSRDDPPLPPEPPPDLDAALGLLADAFGPIEVVEWHESGCGGPGEPPCPDCPDADLDDGGGPEPGHLDAVVAAGPDEGAAA
jgi:hypothetical protein